MADEFKIFSSRNIRVEDEQFEPLVNIWLIEGTGVAKYIYRVIKVFSLGSTT